MGACPKCGRKKLFSSLCSDCEEEKIRTPRPPGPVGSRANQITQEEAHQRLGLPKPEKRK